MPYRYSSISQSHITKEETRETIFAKHAEVKSAITTVFKQLVVLEDKLGELKLSSDDEVASSREGKDETLQQLEVELLALQASQKLLNELLSKLLDQNSGFQAETINGGVSGINFGGDGNSGFQTGTSGVRWGDRNSGFQAGTINGGVSGITFGGKLS